jgi:hypothetical protein
MLQDRQKAFSGKFSEKSGKIGINGYKSNGHQWVILAKAFAR